MKTDNHKGGNIFMVRRTNPVLNTIDGKTYYEFSGKHIDTKPTGSDISTGSTFFEVDTGDVYAYEEESATWLKFCALGGSGS